jgi:hypothetical protein
MLVRSGSDLPELLDLDALIDAVADAMADLSAGRTTVPDRTDAIVPEHPTRWNDLAAQNPPHPREPITCSP